MCLDYTLFALLYLREYEYLQLANLCFGSNNEVTAVSRLVDSVTNHPKLSTKFFQDHMVDDEF